MSRRLSCHVTALAVCAFVACWLAVPAQAASQALTFTTTADASIDEAAPTVANGATAPTDCRVNDDSGARQECRLRFVVSGIQVGDTVTSAKVLIRNKGGAGSKHVN